MTILKRTGAESGELRPQPFGVKAESGLEAGSMDGFLGLLARRTNKIATLEEIEKATAQGWAGER